MTLDKLLCERPKGLPWTELRNIVLHLLDALAYAHTRGVLHGDLNPSNVMLTEEGLRLFDFGLGQAEEGILNGLPSLSRQRFSARTPGYAAPELLEGHPLSSSTDVYAIACVLYELAQGKHPFGRTLSSQTQYRHLQAPKYLPKRCWPALRAALNYNAAERSITARQLHDAMAGSSFWDLGWLRGLNSNGTKTCSNARGISP
jgi:serine/threonine-protein kinase Stk1